MNSLLAPAAPDPVEAAAPGPSASEPAPSVSEPGPSLDVVPPPTEAHDPTRTCVCWGPLGEGEYKHLDCEVIVTQPSMQINTYRVGPYPQVCTCECKTCKTSWWDAGRPRIVNGEVLHK